MSLSRKLTALDVLNCKVAGIHSDGDGLNLKVTPAGSKSWVLRYTFDGKPAMMGLGPYPEVKLAEARERAAEAKKKARSGVNPVQEKREKAATVKAEKAKDVMTFNRCVTEYIAAHRSSWKNEKHADQWVNTLATYASPAMGAVDVAKIEVSHVMAALKPIWKRVPETASRLRGRIETILDWARVMEFRTGDNPARWRGHLEHLLTARNKKETTVNHPALPYEQMSAFMKELRHQKGVSARAVEFAILTGARSGEVRGAAWSEIDEKARLWIIPANRMKAKKEHRCTLSEEALALIAEMKKITWSDLIFFGRNKESQLSNTSLSEVIHRMDAEDKGRDGKGWRDKNDRVITTHGFRSSFRDWVAEITEYPGEMAELALAHTVGSKVVLAYRRGTMIEKRRAMMQDWANYCYPVAVENS